MSGEWVEDVGFGANDCLECGKKAVILVYAENWIERNYFEWEGLK